MMRSVNLTRLFGGSTAGVVAPYRIVMVSICILVDSDNDGMALYRASPARESSRWY
jgi:hypothetical protein